MEIKSKGYKQIERAIISVKRNYPGLMGERHWKESTSYERALIQKGKQELWDNLVKELNKPYDGKNVAEIMLQIKKKHNLI